MNARRGAGLAEMLVALSLFAVVSAAAAAALTGAERYTRRARATLADGTLCRPGDDVATGRVRRNERVERWLASRELTHVVKIVVADSGHGVEHGFEEQIFEPFVTTKAPEHGTGLGLSIVRGIVNSLGGLVWVQRSREGGAAFHIVLPADTRTEPASR